MPDITPKNNTALFGHDKAQALLTQGLASGKLAHGLLITGSKGIGKATLAYRFARQLLSGNSDMEMEENDPIFHRIVAGSHADLLVIEQEYDSKKEEFSREISVEQARGIAGFLSLTPGESNWRVVIIDSVDALNTAGANAILKILEEPPKQALLMLVSHNPGRLLPTIRSRCQTLKLAPLGADDFARTIRHIVPDTDSNELRALRTLAAGAPGAALEIKEQGALEWYAQLLDILAPAPAIDSQRLHTLAGTITAGQVHQNWHILTQLMLSLLERTAKLASGLNYEEAMAGEGACLTKLAALHPAGVWAAKWQQCADQFSLAQRVHLDYKQVIIAFVHSIINEEGFPLGNAVA